MEHPITKDEDIYALKALGRRKSLGPSGWTIEIFLRFEDIMIDELSKMVEESKIFGSIFVATNPTFISLIPTIEKRDSFSNFYPISLCDTTYKLIYKTIDNCLKPFLSSYITTEQFRFLKQC